MKEQNKMSSRLGLIASMTIFGTIGLFVRWIPVTSSILAVIRGFIGAAFLCVWMLLTGKKATKEEIKKNMWLLFFSGAAIGFNWVVISYTHLKFKKSMQRMQIQTDFPSIAYPLTNYLCIAFMIGILLIMSRTPDMQIAVLMIPAWISILLIAYFFKRKQENQLRLLEKTKITSLPEA